MFREQSTGSYLTPNHGKDVQRFAQRAPQNEVDAVIKVAEKLGLRIIRQNDNKNDPIHDTHSHGGGVVRFCHDRLIYNRHLKCQFYHKNARELGLDIPKRKSDQCPLNLEDIWTECDIQDVARALPPGQDHGIVAMGPSQAVTRNRNHHRDMNVTRETQTDSTHTRRQSLPQGHEDVDQNQQDKKRHRFIARGHRVIARGRRVIARGHRNDHRPARLLHEKSRNVVHPH